MVTKNNHFRGKKKHSFYFKQENLNRLLINNRPWNIYRSESENGCYKKVNSMPIIGTYYEDMDLKPHTIYYYKVARLNSAMIEQEQSQPIKSGTTFR